MDTEIIKAFELVLVFGGVLAVGGYQLWTVRRRRSSDASGQGRKNRSEWPD